MEHFFTLNNIINLLTLTGLEIILGVDNLIFIALIVQKLPDHLKNKVRISGLSLALILRILMLFGATWIIKLKEPLFKLFMIEFSGRNILLIFGGLFLIIKTIIEIIELFQDHKEERKIDISRSTVNAIWQIVFIDLILSFDSIITAVGISENINIIIIAIFISMIIMLISSKSIGEFINNNPNLKVIALFFIGLVGFLLALSGLGLEISKGYLYFAVFFSVMIETINIMLKKKVNR